MFRLATFNVENLGGEPRDGPSLVARIAVLRPQLLRLRADIVCLQEVDARRPEGGGTRGLAALDAVLDGTPFAGFGRAVTTGPSGLGPADAHNQVVLSRFPIRAVRQVLHDAVTPPAYEATTAEPAAGPQPVRWDRPVLCVTVDLPGGAALHLVALHLKAPTAANVPGQKIAPLVWRTVPGWAEGMFLAAAKRAGQAFEARLVVDGVFDRDPGALIAVCGDVNATDGELPMRILVADELDTGNGALAYRALVPVERSVPESQRFSVIHGGRRQLLDHILVSRALLGWFRGIEIHNEDLGDEIAMHYGVRGPPESLHAPLVATFEDPAASEARLPVR
ncbi:MAG: endonuclease/exonuclease/phosphatase family protein [Alphaproteobacteria bacterium]